MEGITVISPGMLTSVQDKGIFGYQWSGICPAGAMDLFSLRVANILVGNELDEAGLEVTILGPSLSFETDEVIAITGANLSPALDGRLIDNNRAIAVKKGQVLSFGARKNGCRAYLAFAGGLDVDPLYGSRSTILRVGMGGLDGRALRKGDHIGFRKPRATLKNMANRVISVPDAPTDRVKVRVILGPQDYLFKDSGIEAFLGDEGYVVTNKANRQGYRLEGKEVELKKIGSIVSDGIAPGAVQIPPNQQPIILLSERQSTGGYAKIANVITVDLPKIGQCISGTRIFFETVSLEEAQRAMKDEREFLIRLNEKIESTISISFQVILDGKNYDITVTEEI